MAALANKVEGTLELIYVDSRNTPVLNSTVSDIEHLESLRAQERIARGLKIPPHAKGAYVQSQKDTIWMYTAHYYFFLTAQVLNCFTIVCQERQLS